MVIVTSMVQHTEKYFFFSFNAGNSFALNNEHCLHTVFLEYVPTKGMNTLCT